MRHAPTLALLFVSLAAAGCASSEEESGSSDSALVTLGPTQCKSPAVTSSSKRVGNATATLDGCILARSGETGGQLMSRAIELLSETHRFATVTDDTGLAIFSRFVPLPSQGSLATGLVQDIDVNLNMQFTPSCRIRVVRRLSQGALTLSIVNITPLKATVGIFPVTVVDPNELSLSVHIDPQANGISVVGSTEVTLLQQQESAAQSAQLTRQLFDWMTAELAKPKP